ncbi:hypothetical protein [Parasitella parasitica]|uniref:histidine kinase n=1 Tax=Parasitella parasitica TaxID=35722 RepID=A0A0B7NNQ7_9FUNG|nr:hypothetical protein [Parasitella parasitica]
MSSFHKYASSKEKSLKRSSQTSPPGNFNVNYDTFEVRIPNYTFGRAIELAGAGGLMAVCVGKRIKDNKLVLAKISPHSVRLEREYYITKRLYALPGGTRVVPNAIEYVSLIQDGLAALLYADIQPNDYIYFEQHHRTHYFTLHSLSMMTHSGDLWDEDTVPAPKCNEITLDMFLTFAIECCSALQFLHENGVIHGELRPSAFQCIRGADGSISTKVWNFGGGLNSYEELLLTSSRWRSFMSNESSSSSSSSNPITSPNSTLSFSSLIPTPPPFPQTSGYFQSKNSSNSYSNSNSNSNSTNSISGSSNSNSSSSTTAHSSRFYSPKEFQTSLVYVSPEQTGRTANALDHRADLYSLGILFFVILTDRNPFAGTAMDVIHAILSKNVPLVHTIRNDIPPIISLIIDKLTRKTVDERYDSAYGLREDLIECQQRLESGNPQETLVYFPLGLRDINPVFKVSDGIYGRRKESELISSIIENTYKIHQKEKLKSKKDVLAAVDSAAPASSSPVIEKPVDKTQETSPLKEADNLLRANSSTSLDHTNCEVIVLRGAGGIGKTTLVSTLNVQARHCGYTATAKFDKNQKRPYNGLLRCLSSILRQLLTESEHVIREFYRDLKENLGPQFSNVRLMVNMVPELKPILYDYRERINLPDDDALSNILNTETRFHSCLDDLQEADEPSIHLISALIYSRTTMLVILTFRDGDEAPQQVVDILEKCVNPVTTIQLVPLERDGLRDLVLDTFYNTHRASNTRPHHEMEQEQRQHVETIMPLVDIIYSWTRGNPFYAKQFLKTMKRKDDIWFDWTTKNWKFRLDNIKKLFDNTKQQPQQQQFPPKKAGGHSAAAVGFLQGQQQQHQQQQYHHPNQSIFDVRNLVSHLRSLDLSAQYFIMWASLMGHVFNFRRIKWLMMASSTGGDTSDENSSTKSCSSNNSSNTAGSSHKTCNNEARKFHSNNTMTATSSPPVLTFEEEQKRSNQAMLGLQIALHEGIIQYKVGNDFHFIHDRYCQAASMLIVDPAQRENMHLKIGQMLMMEEDIEEDDNVFLTADHFVKSAGLIRLFENRKCYRQVLVKAGNEATLSGALQISAIYYQCALSLLDDDIEARWHDGPDSSFSETLNIYMKILELKMLNIDGNVSCSNVHQDDTTVEKIQFTDVTTVATFKSIMADDSSRLANATARIAQDEARDSMVKQIMDHTQGHPFERAQAWRIQARICFQQSQYRKGISNILQGLQELGIVVDTNITDQEALQYYQAVKVTMTTGFEQLLAKSSPCQNPKQIAMMALLNEACTGAYWVNPILVEFFALKLCELSLEYGYTSASGGGFIWAGCTATRVSEFTFAAQLGKFGMAISEKYAGNSEIARAIIVHHALLAQWTGVHVREYIYQYQRAYKYAIAGGDQLFSSMALFHVASTLYWTSCNLSELRWHLNHSMEECSKGSSKDVLILNVSLWRSVLVFQGKTDMTMDPEKMMNDADSNFDEPSFVQDVKSQSVHSGNPLNWHYSFKMILLFHFGFTRAASDLGFKIFDNSVNEAVHRHVGIAMYYHCIAIVESLRDPGLDPSTRERYEKQLHKNEKRLNELATHSEVNYRMYHKVVQAQISTLDTSNLDKSLRLYNQVMQLALKGNWYSFLGLTFELASEHYMRCGLTVLAVPTLTKSIEFYSRWGAWGKVRYLKTKYSKQLESLPVAGKEDVAVQTDDVIVGLTTTVADKNFSIWDNNSSDETTPDPSLKEIYSNQDPQQQQKQQQQQVVSVGTGPENKAVIDSHDEMLLSSNKSSNNNMASEEEEENIDVMREETLFSLDMVDLTSIIKSSQDYIHHSVISNEMNSFDELLKKMMGIIMGNSGAESGAIIVKEGVFGIAAYSVRSTDTCQTYEPPLALGDDDDDKVSTSIVHYVIHTHAKLFISNVEGDARFNTGDAGMKKGAVICMPIMHKSTLVGVLYLHANLNAFTHKHANVLALLCDQIGISITNALLFKSVQKATKANALMIESQLKALEEARASREQALRATKMKSNFLANMSHELRTPFSGFYGMISLLSETRLDAEQREFVSIAKQSCEMLLHIIDDLLDFSKLEAHKVKLLYGLFYIEDLIADRMELLITLATNKNVELTYSIDQDVPSIIFGDGNRIGQILMNLIGNAIKFTHHGQVVVRCSVDNSSSEMQQEPDDMTLRISVQDTGIGMSEEEIKGLFLPFSQVDGSTTRNFGGTGLGLSICLQLVKLMHGEIHVDSVVNKGSTFSFTIQVKTVDMVANVDASYDARNSSIQELQQQLGQPRLLIVGPERVKSMIQSFIPWVNCLEHEISVAEGIDAALFKAEKSTPYDVIVLDSPKPEDLLFLIKQIEETPALGNMRILIMLAPTVDNMRRHFAQSTVMAHNDKNLVSAVKAENHKGDHLQHYHVFHPLLTRLSKPIRTLKLLNALVKVLTASTTTTNTTTDATETNKADQKTLLALTDDIPSSKDSAATTPVDSSSVELLKVEPVPEITPILITPAYSRTNHEAFSPEELAQFKGKKILVAEDNFIAQRLIVKQLDRLGFMVDKCNNGFECFDTWKARGPGFFILAWIDHHMPGCDGLEATRKIRAHEKEMGLSPTLPIIALTADIQSTAQTNCFNAGMNDYVTKPLMQKDLAKILRKYCL